MRKFIRDILVTSIVLFAVLLLVVIIGTVFVLTVNLSVMWSPFVLIIGVPLFVLLIAVFVVGINYAFDESDEIIYLLEKLIRYEKWR